MKRIEKRQIGNIEISQGLPTRYAKLLSRNKGKAVFKTIIYKKNSSKIKTISNKSQKKWFTGLGTMLPRGRIIGISSEPTDNLGMILASILLQKSIKRGEHSIMVNLALAKKQYDLYSSLFIHNITDKITLDRIIKLRDIISIHTNISTILVIGGIDAYSFFANILRHPVDYILHPSDYILNV